MQRLIDHLCAFLAGVTEFRQSFTKAYPHDDDLSVRYDQGRELAHRLTFRRYEA
ncbi:hypothetical protein OF001_U20250 [Pseudomonas sp. OF001]|uniref:hypothetical protein n=1 Tax=Pseudomonas sp. OF001 TaxID=2772300 RepID=UPI001919EEB0|nr:hypothetical protein [Pseudomonas sp. OF001]CAD5377323.1 hypothetical protein OF001_U20250 [Pseudomonas sp. OF001]